MWLDIPATDPGAFLWALPFTLAIAIWVSWSDMKFMKIPNKAVVALAAVWPLGVLFLPWQVWLWGFALMAIVLVITFIGNMAGLFGAGDAKFAAASAPFFTGADLRLLMALYAACALGAFAAHRIMRAIPAMRRATPDWKSWTNPKFPFGLALSGMLIFYPLLALIMP